MVTINDMKDKLLTLDEVQEKISATEPLTQKIIHEGNKISFAFDPTWAVGLDEKEGIDTVDGAIRIDGVDHQLTKDAVLQAGAAFGLPGKYGQKLPSYLLEQQLNYWFDSGLGEREFNMLSTGADGRVSAFTRPTISPFSNNILIGEVIRGIRDRYGNSEIYADYKFNHSLVRTDIRFIVPEASHIITGGGLSDVPSTEDDVWAGGIHLSNSLIGKSQTSLESYLFRWWCTNGATTLMDNVGAWSRRGDHGEQDVYEWAANAVDEVLGGLESQFDRVQALTSLNVAGNVGDVIQEIFDTYKVPVSQRQGVIDTLVEAENLSLYSVMNAITQTANEPGLSSDRIDKILRITGAIPGTTFNQMKAKIFAEGQTAGVTAPNPYLIG